MFALFFAALPLPCCVASSVSPTTDEKDRACSGTTTTEEEQSSSSLDVANVLTAEILRELRHWSVVEPLADQHLYELSLRLREQVRYELEYITDESDLADKSGRAPVSRVERAETPPPDAARYSRKMDAKEAQLVIQTLLKERAGQALTLVLSYNPNSKP